MSHAPVRIAVVNDYEIVAAGVAAVLATYTERIAVVEIDSRTHVLSQVDVILYDSFGQLQGDSVDVADLVRDSGARLVVFSWNIEADLVERAMARGASGYVSKSVSAEELVDALERVHRGEVVTPSPEQADVTAEFGRWPGDELGLAPREAEVLALICQGLSNQEIAERAFIGMNTVKTYIRTLYQKIGVESRTRALLWGIDHGFRPDRSRQVVGDRNAGS